MAIGVIIQLVVVLFSVTKVCGLQPSYARASFEEKRPLQKLLKNLKWRKHPVNKNRSIEELMKNWTEHTVGMPAEELMKNWTKHPVGTPNLCLEGHLVPEMFFLGAQKGGTTSVATIVLRHPGIRTFQRDKETWTFFFDKEPHIFDEFRRFGNGKSWWAESYPNCTHETRLVSTDFTPDVLAHPQAPVRIATFYGSEARRIKFFVTLRNPLSRMHSGFYNGKRDGWWEGRAKEMSFSDYVRKSLKKKQDILGWPYNGQGQYRSRTCYHSTGNSYGCLGALGKSMYADQLKNFFSYFDSAQFTIVLFEQMVSPPDENRSVYNQIFRTLGLNTVHNQNLEQLNALPRPEILLELGDRQLSKLQEFIDVRTGPKVVAEILANSSATLYEYDGPRHANAIAEWLEKGWGS